MKIGCHVSSAGKIWKVFERAENLGVNCLQTFAGSPQTWKLPEYSEDDVEKFIDLHIETGIDPVFIHSMYLINLASDKNNIRFGSIGSLTKSLEIADKLGIAGVITHTGSHGGRGFAEVLPTVQKSLERVFEGMTRNSKAKLFLENAAGAGGIIGSTISELGQIIRSVDADERIGICVDTCHAFVSGYDLRQLSEIDRLAREIETDIGADRLGAIHLNDSKGDLGSKLDRHEIIGKGKLGLETFKMIINHPFFKEFPFILETPDLKFDVKEIPESIMTLKSLV